MFEWLSKKKSKIKKEIYKNKNFGFNLAGGPFYIRLRKGIIHYTKEISSGEVNCDFSEDGELLGIEILTDHIEINND